MQCTLLSYETIIVRLLDYFRGREKVTLVGHFKRLKIKVNVKFSSDFQYFIPKLQTKFEIVFLRFSFSLFVLCIFFHEKCHRISNDLFHVV